MAAKQSTGSVTTREHVISHAAVLIRERGFRATSIGDVLAKAGVQKGSFYAYFPSKEDLGYAVIDRWLSEQEARLHSSGPAADGPPPLDRISTILASVLAEQEANACRGGCAFGNLAAELADVHEGFRTRIQTAFERFRGTIAALLEQARARADVRAELDPTAMADFLVACVEGGILLAKVHKRSDPLANALRIAEAHLSSYRTG